MTLIKRTLLSVSLGMSLMGLGLGILFPLRAADVKMPPLPLPVIVLDPGHGGIDAGAILPSGLAEKNVTLDFARALAAQLKASGRYRVILTRESDIFISLSARVRKARQAQAALFISLHADTLNEDSTVSGTTFYTLSEQASDAEAGRLAEKENHADRYDPTRSSPDQEEVENILLDLTFRETRAYSRLLAKTLLSSWHNVGTLNKNPLRSAGFKVLQAPDVPSVLLELGYLSSQKDLTHLTSPQWRVQASQALSQAIDTFLTHRNDKENVLPSPPK